MWFQKKKDDAQTVVSNEQKAEAAQALRALERNQADSLSVRLFSIR